MSNPSVKRVIATAFLTILLLGSDRATAETLRVGGTGVALGGMRILGEAFQRTNPDVTVDVLPSLGSGGGLKAVIAGAIDLSVSARALKDAEKDQGAVATLYATTPLAIVTSAKTDTDGITTEQLAQMYAGTMQTWPSGEPVRIILRPISETDVQILRDLSDEMAQAIDAASERPGLLMATNDQDNAEALENLSGSIGAVALGQIKTERRRLKVLALDGKLPKVSDTGEQAVGYAQTREGTRAFAKSLYIVRAGDTSETAQQFMAFVLSPEGRAILEAYDHAVPQ